MSKDVITVHGEDVVVREDTAKAYRGGDWAMISLAAFIVICELLLPVLVEVPNPGHPIGIRGVGEVPIVPPPAAIANAIYRAVGVRMTELPMSPPKVVKAILEKK